MSAEGPLLCVITVTYNSAGEIGGLLRSLPDAASGLPLQVLIVDNGSTDDTRAAVAALHGTPGLDRLTFLESGGNLGYAGGVNVGLTHVDPTASAIAILNPDLVARPGSLRALADALVDGVGLAAPRIVGPDGHLFHSLRKDADLLGTLGEALFGGKWASRPVAWGDTLRAASDYETPRDVDWVSGAALAVSRECWERVGRWDESYFLYSEETEYARRVRQAGFRVRFVPAAEVVHVGGASGSSPAQVALEAVNRVRDFETHHTPGGALAFRGILIAQHTARAFKPGSRAALRALLDRSSWASLPHATRPAPIDDSPLTGAIIIPAHNEAGVIGRLLDGLAADGGLPGMDVVVACNGCTDGTEEVAARHRPGLDVRVLDLPVASKQAAMNAAEEQGLAFPRLYLDADVEVSPAAVRAVVRALESGRVLAARPPLEYATAEASGLVRAFYRARSRTPSLVSALWGAGFFAVSEAGRARWDRFPTDEADDLFVETMFAGHEKAIVAADPVRVHVPRTTRALVRTLKRVYRREDADATPRPGERSASGSTLVELLRSNAPSPFAIADALAYIAIVIAARVARRLDDRAGRTARWERDDTSR